MGADTSLTLKQFLNSIACRRRHVLQGLCLQIFHLSRLYLLSLDIDLIKRVRTRIHHYLQGLSAMRLNKHPFLRMIA